jgi:hypothetical protein
MFHKKLETMKKNILLGIFIFTSLSTIFAQDFTFYGQNGFEYERISETKNKFKCVLSDVTIHYFKNKNQIHIIEGDSIRCFNIEDEIWDNGLIDYMVLLEDSKEREEMKLDFDGIKIILFEELDDKSHSFKIIKEWEEK